MCVMITTASELRVCNCALIIAIPVPQDRELLTQQHRGRLLAVQSTCIPAFS